MAPPIKFNSAATLPAGVSIGQDPYGSVDDMLAAPETNKAEVLTNLGRLGWRAFQASHPIGQLFSPLANAAGYGGGFTSDVKPASTGSVEGADVELPAAQQPSVNMAEPAVSGPSLMRLESGSSQYTSPELPKSAGRRYLSQQEQLDKAQSSLIRKKEEDIQKYYDDTYLPQVGQWESYRKDLAAKYGAKIPVLEKKLADAEKEASESMNRLKEAKVDPDRLINSMPWYAQALQAVLVAFEEGTSALARRPGAGIQLVQRMIDRDIQTQRVNIEQRMATLGMQRQDVARLSGQVDAYQEKLRGAAEDLFKIELLKLGAKKEGLEAKNAAASEILGLGYRRAETEKQIAKETSGRSVSTKTFEDRVVMPKESKLATPPPKMFDSVDAANNLLTQFDALEGYIKKNGWSIAKDIPFTETKKMKDIYVKRMVGALRDASGEVGVMDRSDAKRQESAINNFLTGKEDMLSRISILRSQAKSAIARKLQSRAPYFNVAPLAQQLGISVGSQAQQQPQSTPRK